MRRFEFSYQPQPILRIPFAAARAPMVVDFIGRDSKEPRFEPSAAGLRIKFIGMIQNTQPCLLQQLLSLVPRQPLEITQQGLKMTGNQHIPGSRIPILETPHQRLIRLHGRLSRLGTAYGHRLDSGRQRHNAVPAVLLPNARSETIQAAKKLSKRFYFQTNTKSKACNDCPINRCLTVVGALTMFMPLPGPAKRRGGEMDFVQKITKSICVPKINRFGAPMGS